MKTGSTLFLYNPASLDTLILPLVPIKLYLQKQMFDLSCSLPVRLFFELLRYNSMPFLKHYAFLITNFRYTPKLDTPLNFCALLASPSLAEVQSMCSAPRGPPTTQPKAPEWVQAGMFHV